MTKEPGPSPNNQPGAGVRAARDVRFDVIMVVLSVICQQQADVLKWITTHLLIQLIVLPRHHLFPHHLYFTGVGPFSTFA